MSAVGTHCSQGLPFQAGEVKYEQHRLVNRTITKKKSKLESAGEGILEKGAVELRPDGEALGRHQEEAGARQRENQESHTWRDSQCLMKLQAPVNTGDPGRCQRLAAARAVVRSVD